MAENVFKRLVKRFQNKSITSNSSPNFQEHQATGLIDSFFSYWLGSSGGFSKYTNAYGENPLVYMVVKKISFSSASMKRVLYNEEGQIKDSSVILELLKSPNQEDDEIEFREKINEFLLLTGNAFIRVIRGEGGLGVELEVLMTQKVDIVCNENNSIVLGYTYTLSNGKLVTYSTEDILHIKTSNVVNVEGSSVKYGLSPLQSAWIVVASSMEKLKADASIFKSRGIIGILTTDSDTPMLEPERDKLQTHFDNSIGGSENYNKIKVSTSRLRYLQTGMSPTDLKLLDGILSSLRLLCGIYGIPSVLFNDTASSTYNNVESAKRTAYTDVYIPLANKVDKELSKWLSYQLGVEEFIEVDLTSIEEIKASTNEVAQALNNSQTNVSTKIMESMTKDEVRELVGLDNLSEGGEELTGQANTSLTIGTNEN
jgi:HK97 family phage portal protein